MIGAVILIFLVGLAWGGMFGYEAGYRDADKQWVAKVDRLNEQLKNEGLVVKKEIR